MSESESQEDNRRDSWFVIWTESRAEKKVESRMAALGLSPWLPTITEKHLWSDRWRDVVLPLFPGYLFARADRAEWHTVLRTRGVLTVIKHEGKPALLDDEFVSSLREAVERGRDHGIAPITDFEPGDPVVVVQDGPLKGVRGVVREKRSGRQLIVWVQEIGRGLALTIGSALVEPAG